MAARNAIKNITILKIQAKAMLRSIRKETDRTMEAAMIAGNGYNDNLVTTVAAILNEMASTNGGKRFPMGEEDVLNALMLLDSLAAFNLEVVHMGIYQDDETEKESDDTGPTIPGVVL
jgi:hypothetical protein